MRQQLQVCCYLLYVVSMRAMVPDGYLPANVCPQGWFGASCAYKCHCQKRDECDKVSGACGEGDSCQEDKFFGPGCQYVDLLHLHHSLDTPTFLRDGNLDTCNPDTNSKSLEVFLTQAVYFHWFRLDTSSDMSNKDLYVELGYEVCKERRMYRVTDNLLDISCEDLQRYSRLFLRGPTVSYICGISISGGRNVALKQETSQSGVFLNSGKCNSDNAVDGNTNSTFDAGWCSSHNDGTESPWWRLHYNRPQKLTRILIVNLIDRRLGLNKFRLELFNKKNGPHHVFNYTETTSSNGGQYEVDVLDMHHLVDSLLISLLPTQWNKHEVVLTLCEVETYGETICEEGHFGLYCHKICHCGPSEICSQVSGACSTPCEKSATGVNCSYPCQPNCLEKKCLDEKCYSCRTGFMGAYCDEECPKGKFGDQCQKTCSSNCSGGLCSITTGNCFSCIGKQVMPLCVKDECSHGWFGEKCDERCSINCHGAKCNSTNGNCFRCIGEQSLPLCKEVKDNKRDSDFNMVYLLPFLLLLFLVVCLACCFSLLKRRSKEQGAESIPSDRPQTTNADDDKFRIMEQGSAVDVIDSLDTESSSVPVSSTGRIATEPLK